MSGIFYGGLPRESVIVVVPSVIRVNTTFSFNEYIAKDKYIWVHALAVIELASKVVASVIPYNLLSFTL